MSNLRIAVFVVLCSVPDVAYCAEQSGVPAGTMLVKTVAILMSVCLLAVVTLRWALPRLAAPRLHPRGRLRLLERLDLGGASLALVDVDGRTLLIAHGPGGVQLLEDAHDVSRETSDDRGTP